MLDALEKIVQSASEPFEKAAVTTDNSFLLIHPPEKCLDLHDMLRDKCFPALVSRGVPHASMDLSGFLFTCFTEEEMRDQESDEFRNYRLMRQGLSARAERILETRIQEIASDSPGTNLFLLYSMSKQGRPVRGGHEIVGACGRRNPLNLISDEPFVAPASRRWSGWPPAKGGPSVPHKQSSGTRKRPQPNRALEPASWEVEYEQADLCDLWIYKFDHEPVRDGKWHDLQEAGRASYRIVGARLQFIALTGRVTPRFWRRVQSAFDGIEPIAVAGAIEVVIRHEADRYAMRQRCRADFVRVKAFTTAGIENAYQLLAGNGKMDRVRS